MEGVEIPVRPDLSGYNLVDTDQTADLIELGYREMKTTLERLGLERVR
jgi:hypothetical protein